MSYRDQVIARFGLRVVIPAVTVLVGALVIVLISLSEMASEVNVIEDRMTARAVDTAVKATLQNLQRAHKDYAHWDDAARHAYGDVDETFMADTFTAATRDPVYFDTMMLMDEVGRVRFAARHGETFNGEPVELIGRAYNTLAHPLIRDGTTYDVRSGLVDTSWGLALVAVGTVVPLSEGFEPRASRSRLILLARAFDETLVASLREQYLIDDLQLLPAGSGDPRAQPLVDVDGKPVAALAWAPPTLGTEAQNKVSPTVFMMLALVGLTMAFLIAIALRGMREVERRDAAAQHAATHDELSGLPNRQALVAMLDEALAAHRADGTSVTVVYLDIDGFKEVNDAFGHGTGDRLLKQVALGFSERAPGTPIARVGGDEFAVVVRGHGAVRTACDLGWRLISSVSETFEIDGRMIGIGASVGVAVADASTPSAEELLRRADVAMDQARQQGRNRLFVYDAVIDTVRHERLEIAADLRKALREGELSLAYQPIFDAETRVIIGVEALVRWDRPNLGPLPPAVFVPIAEQTGLIDELGGWTIRQACLDALMWPGVRLSVNVSPAQFRDPNFETQVAKILRDTGFPPERLELEVTESYFIANSEQARRAIDTIRSLGISVSLDDFGSGYSSIGYLRSFNFDKLKLDRSLIVGLGNDERVQRMVEATIALAEALDLDVTAEGVETDEEAALLLSARCVAFQGFFFAKPSSAAAITGMLDAAGPLKRPAASGVSSVRHAQLGHPG